ncbi:MAG: sigma-70 family RNA polymerase sigma factor [Verrucomicrobiales bacterium]
MPDDHPTRQTLLLRLRDRADGRAWSEFVEIYTPLVFAYCQKREIGRPDAADICQEVMRSVSLAMGNFRYDPEKGRFRAWLFTAVRHAVGRHFRKLSSRPLSVSETRLLDALDREPDAGEAGEWERDYQRQLLAWALEKIRPEFAPRIWQVFEATALEERPPDEVAAETGMTRNAIAIAKHRVLARLRDKACSVDDGRWEQDLIGGGAG